MQAICIKEFVDFLKTSEYNTFTRKKYNKVRYTNYFKE